MGVAEKLSVVIPVFNEEEGLEFACQRLRRVAQTLNEHAGISNTEFIFVDDGSRDRSWAVLDNERAKFAAEPCSEIRSLRLSRNFGHSAAVFAGLEHCTGDLVAVLDADLQDPPELLVDMIAKLRSEEADVVYGQRQTRVGDSVFKKATAWLFYRMLNLFSSAHIPRDTGDFRVMTREVCDAVASLQENEPFMRGLVAWVGFKQIPFLYDRQQREHGSTKYPVWKMMKFAYGAMVSFSLSPLRLVIYCGGIGILFCTAISIHALRLSLEGTAIPGWASTILGFAFGQSITLFMIGILGIYLGRIHMALQRRPRYILKKDRDARRAHSTRIREIK